MFSYVETICEILVSVIKTMQQILAFGIPHRHCSHASYLLVACILFFLPFSNFRSTGLDLTKLS